MLTINEILSADDTTQLINGNPDSVVSAVVTDTRKVCDQAIFLALKGERYDGHDFLTDAMTAGASALMVTAEFAASRPIPEGVTVLSSPDMLKSYQKIANYYRNKLSDLIVIGITGSCGKTSAKEILRTLLSAVCGEEKIFATEANNNNHIGVPLSLLSVKPEHRFAVIEMGTNHPGEIEVLAKIAEPNISIITTIARAHLEFLKDLNGVAKEKSAILESYWEGSPPIAIIPEECPGNQILRDSTGEYIYTFGNDNADINVSYLGGNTKGSTIRFSFSGQFEDAGIPEMEINWPLHGKHQAMNAAAATLAVLAIAPGRLQDKELLISRALSDCRLTGMRMQFSELDGIEWVNDAYNANPDSMKVAIEWLAEFANNPTSYIILGDMLEMGEQGPFYHEEILKLAVKSLPEAKVYTVGPIMAEAAERVPLIKETFPDSETAGNKLKKFIDPANFVFLKGSRGIALEKIQSTFLPIKNNA